MNGSEGRNQGERLLLTRKEAAKSCGLCEKTLQNHTAPRGALIATYVGRSVRYSPNDLKVWVDSLRGNFANGEGGGDER